MSFWTWIGLADRKTVIQLQEEVNRLQEENHRLTEEKASFLYDSIEKQTQLIIATINDSKTEVINETQSQANDIREQGKGVETKLNEGFEEISKGLSSILGLVNNRMESIDKSIDSHFISLESDVEDKLKSVKNKIDSILTLMETIKKESEEAISANQSKIDLVITQNNDLKENSKKMDDFEQAVQNVNVSLVNLWKLAKVVFIDSVLTDIDKL